MTPQFCLVRLGDDEAGDCYRACIASILNMPVAAVPNFCELGRGEPNGETRIAREWLAQFGLTIWQTWCTGEWKFADVLHWFSAGHPDAPVVLSGACKGDHHAVVLMGGKVAHDPSGAGIEGPCEDGNYWFDIISVGSNWKAAAE